MLILMNSNQHHNNNNHENNDLTLQQARVGFLQTLAMNDTSTFSSTTMNHHYTNHNNKYNYTDPTQLEPFTKYLNVLKTHYHDQQKQQQQQELQEQQKETQEQEQRNEQRGNLADPNKSVPVPVPPLVLSSSEYYQPTNVGIWKALLKPNFYDCLGYTIYGHPLYTLSRMSFKMYPYHLLCSIQNTYNSIEPIQSYNERKQVIHQLFNQNDNNKNNNQYHQYHNDNSTTTASSSSTTTSTTTATTSASTTTASSSTSITTAPPPPTIIMTSAICTYK